MINFELVLEDKVFMCNLSKKARKNINVSIKVNNQINISKPKRVSIRQIKRYLNDNKQWIIQKSNQINELFALRNNYLTKDSLYVYGKEYRLKVADVKQIQMLNNTILIKSQMTKIELEDYLKQTLFDYIAGQRQHLDEMLAHKDMDAPTIKVKNMRGKWGSCYINKELIHLNNKLIHYPKFCINYVLLHEYVHLIIPNHSKQFYEIIKHYMPDYKKAIKYLKTN